MSNNKKEYNVKPSPRQIQAVDNWVSGKYKSKKAAIIDAGYDELTANRGDDVFKRKGAQIYIKTLSVMAKRRFNMPIANKIMGVYLDGLDATKLYGKDAVEHPDHRTRKEFADRLSELIEFVPTTYMPGSAPQGKGANFNQFNFFSMAEKERENYNNNFKDFLTKYYKE